MKCEKCDQKAVSTKPALCKDHFDEFILNTVQKTIDEYELFTKDQTICVAVSGGKDSLALIDVLTRLGYTVEGLFINEGIANYREYSVEDLDSYVKKTGLKVRRVSFESEAGFTLDAAMNTKKFHACTICGTMRRYMLNKYAQDYEVIATGHNLDDEAQTVLMNLSRGNTSMFLRTGPKTLKNDEYVTRVKPFYFVSEKHILTYCVLHSIKTDFSECPYATKAVRMVMTEELNKFEEEHPGTKRHILDTYLQMRKELIAIDDGEEPTEIPDHKTAGDLVGKPSKALQVMEEVKRAL